MWLNVLVMTIRRSGNKSGEFLWLEFAILKIQHDVPKIGDIVLAPRLIG